MHNCLRGRDGTKFGLKDAGFAWLPSQREGVNSLHQVFDDAQVMVACNNVKPAKQASHDLRVNGRKLVSTSVGIVDEGCLGGGKKDQLVCRRALAEWFACDYDRDVSIQPRQYLLSSKQDCSRVVSRAQNEPSRPWLLKPSVSLRGRGIKYFANSQLLLEAVSDCESDFHVDDIVQEYVTRPALMDEPGHKFDVRTWMLIASIDPLVIFYRHGFARVAHSQYQEESTDAFAHITNLDGQQQRQQQQQQPQSYLRSFDEVSAQLTSKYGFPDKYMHRGFKQQIMRAQTYAALAQFLPEAIANKKASSNRRGFYHVFACDSVVDQDQRVHLLECNGFPAESQQVVLEKRILKTTTGGTGGGDPQQVWKEMISLVLNLHLDPASLLTGERNTNTTTTYKKQGMWRNPPPIRNGRALSVRQDAEEGESQEGGYAYGTWELAFNELETPLDTVNACEPDFVAVVSKKIK